MRFTPALKGGALRKMRGRFCRYDAPAHRRPVSRTWRFGGRRTIWWPSATICASGVSAPSSSWRNRSRGNLPPAIDECGYGVRLSTYEFTDEELHTTIEELSDDQALAARLGAAAKRLHASPGRLRAADLIEKIARG
jgi:hypothetical protein